MNTTHTNHEYSTPQVVVLGSLTTLTQGDVHSVSNDWGDMKPAQK
jgi:hypothetical protein